MVPPKRDRARERRSSALDKLRARADRELSDTSLNSFRGPFGRWFVVLCWLGSVAGLVAAAWMNERTLVGVLVVVVLGTAWFLRRVVRSMADLPEWLLDERMEGVRNRVYRNAYRALVAIVTGALVAMWIASDVQLLGFALQADHLGALLWLVVSLALGLPSAVVALTVRDL